MCVWTSWAHIYEYLILLFKIGCDNMHVENALVEFVAAGEQEYEEVIEEYEEEVFV